VSSYDFWTPNELEIVARYAEKVRGGWTIYRACKEMMPLLPDRTWDAIRSKLKKLHGTTKDRLAQQ
jgi:hypothetical protein